MISFVYFDIGGVAILDFSGTDKWERLKAGIGVTPQNAAAFDAVWKRNRDRICIDRSVDSMMPELSREVGLSFPPGYSMLEDFVDRFEPNPSIWPVVAEIAKTCRIGLLTNMYPGMYDAIVSRGILPPVIWDIVIDSSVVGMQKPDPAIFTFASGKADVPEREILFVENTPLHIAAAIESGWNTFRYDHVHPKESSDALKQYFHSLRGNG